VLGFPIGGDRLSITEGIVSRIEMTPYAHSQRNLLAVQIDAAINSGNSGGPVVKDGELVGLAFEAMEDAENIGYMIGAPVVQHFLRDVEQGIQDGFPELGVVTQQLESKAHRRSLGLKPNSHGGILITQVVHGQPDRESQYQGKTYKQPCRQEFARYCLPGGYRQSQQQLNGAGAAFLGPQAHRDGRYQEQVQPGMKLKERIEIGNATFVKTTNVKSEDSRHNQEYNNENPGHGSLEIAG
jgi:hypothetical protein